MKLKPFSSLLKDYQVVRNGMGLEILVYSEINWDKREG